MHKGKISDLFLISPEFPWAEFLKLTYDHEIPDDHNVIYSNKKYLTDFYQFINSTETRYYLFF